MSDFGKTTKKNYSSDDTTLNKCLKSDKGFYRILHPKFRLISDMYTFSYICSIQHTRQKGWLLITIYRG